MKSLTSLLPASLNLSPVASTSTAAPTTTITQTPRFRIPNPPTYSSNFPCNPVSPNPVKPLPSFSNYRPPPPRTSFNSQDEPMNIDTARRQGLCFKCHQRGHRSFECPGNRASIRQMAEQVTVAEAVEVLQRALDREDQRSKDGKDGQDFPEGRE